MTKAGAVVAGGVVTDVLGGPGFLDSGDIVAAGAAFQPTLLEVTRDAFGGAG